MAIAIAYPYAKRFVSMPQAVLGVAFSFGIPMAFAAVQSRVPLLAWVLLLGNLFWVLAYDTEYAMVDRDDDLKIGMKTSAITLGRADVPVIMACYASYLLIWAVALAGRIPLAAIVISTAAAAAQAVWHYTLIRGRDARGLLQGFPPEPLAGVHAVCRRRGRLRAERSSARRTRRRVPRPAGARHAGP